MEATTTRAAHPARSRLSAARLVPTFLPNPNSLESVTSHPLTVPIPNAQVCPSLVRVFVNHGSNHPTSDYAIDRVPRGDEFEIYTW